MYELLLEEGNQSIALGRVGTLTVAVGRGSPCDIIVPRDATVSTRHAAFWETGGRLYVQDLGSRNGTWLGERRVVGTEPVVDADVVRLGTNTRIRVRRIPDVSPELWALEDVKSGVRWTLRRERFFIGDGAGADLVLPGSQTSVLLVGSDEVWLGSGDEAVHLEPGKPFELDGRTFSVRRVPAEPGETMEVNEVRYAYNLDVALDTPAARAEVSEPSTQRRCVIDAENRAVLLYLLARKLRDDRAAGTRPDEAGWCADDDLSTGIWGRAEAVSQGTNLNVLLCRVRRDVREAGFDPWFIERRRRFLRVRVDQVSVR